MFRSPADRLAIAVVTSPLHRLPEPLWHWLGRPLFWLAARYLGII